jgi:hypothetical protein
VRRLGGRLGGGGCGCASPAQRPVQTQQPSNPLLPRRSLELLQALGARLAPGSAAAAAAGLEVVSVVPFTVLVELDALNARGGSSGGGAPGGVAAAARAALRWLSGAMAGGGGAGGAVRGESLQVRLWARFKPGFKREPPCTRRCGACSLCLGLGPSPYALTVGAAPCAPCPPPPSRFTPPQLPPPPNLPPLPQDYKSNCGAWAAVAAAGHAPSGDDRILAAALALARGRPPGAGLLLLTNDTALRVKARASGLGAAALADLPRGAAGGGGGGAASGGGQAGSALAVQLAALAGMQAAPAQQQAGHQQPGQAEQVLFQIHAAPLAGQDVSLGQAAAHHHQQQPQQPQPQAHHHPQLAPQQPQQHQQHHHQHHSPYPQHSSSPSARGHPWPQPHGHEPPPQQTPPPPHQHGSHHPHSHHHHHHPHGHSPHSEQQQQTPSPAASPAAACLLFASLTCHVSLPPHAPGQRGPHLTLTQLMELTLQLLATVWAGLEGGAVDASRLAGPLGSCAEGLGEALRHISSVEAAAHAAAAAAAAAGAPAPDPAAAAAALPAACGGALMQAAAALLGVCETLRPARGWYAAEAAAIADQEAAAAWLADAAARVAAGALAPGASPAGAAAAAAAGGLRRAGAALVEALAGLR